MRTRAKFYVQGVTLLPGESSGVEVSLGAVSRGDRNASWAQATPVGSIKMTINNPVAAQGWIDFQMAARSSGKSPELFVDLYPAEDGWAGDGHKFRPSEGAEGTVYDPKYCGECGRPQDEKMRYGGVESEDLVHPNG